MTSAHALGHFLRTLPASAAATYLALFFCLGGPLVRRLGPGAVGAINKIFGFLILAIAVQLVWDGIADF